LLMRASGDRGAVRLRPEPLASSADRDPALIIPLA
jgi:hypothetical protein